MITPTTHIGDDLDRLSSLAAILVSYIETETNDQHLANTAIGFKEMLDQVKAKHFVYNNGRKADHEAQ